jgi:hypothetical protein
MIRKGRSALRPAPDLARRRTLQQSTCPNPRSKLPPESHHRFKSDHVIVLFPVSVTVASYGFQAKAFLVFDTLFCEP